MYVIDSLIEGNPAKAMDAVRHLILPSIVLAAFTMGLITRTTRSNLLDALSTDYVRTAKAKGLNSICLILKTCPWKCPDPGYYLPGTAGCFYFMRWFRSRECILYPGTGTLFRTVYSRTVTIRLSWGTTIFLATFIILMNLVVDLLYKVADPRISLTREETDHGRE